MKIINYIAAGVLGLEILFGNPSNAFGKANLETKLVAPVFQEVNSNDCAKYARLAAKGLSGAEYIPANAWSFSKSNNLVVKVNKDLGNYEKLLVPGKTIVSFYYPKSKFHEKAMKESGNDVTHVALYAGEEYGEIMFYENAGKLQRKISLSGLKQRGYEAREIIEPNNSTADKIEQKIEPKIEQKVDYIANDFSQDSNEVLLARMLYGETRDCSKEERIEVAFTPINRINDGKKWNGENLKEAILKKTIKKGKETHQYSCFNKGNVNLEELKNPEKYDAKSFGECLKIASEVLDGKYKEFNKGQTHYFNPELCHPYWADSDKMIFIPTENTKHKFYIEK